MPPGRRGGRAGEVRPDEHEAVGRERQPVDEQPDQPREQVAAGVVPRPARAPEQAADEGEQQQQADDAGFRQQLDVDVVRDAPEGQS